MAKGKNILHLTEICNKYETEREQVQPFKPQTSIEKAQQIPNEGIETLADFKEVRFLFHFFFAEVNFTFFNAKNVLKMMSKYF